MNTKVIWRRSFRSAHGFALGAAVCLAPRAHANNILNTHFEESGLPLSTFLAWEESGNSNANIAMQDVMPFDFDYHATMFGPGLMEAGGQFIQSDTYLFQSSLAVASQQWNASVWVAHPSEDPLMGANFASLELQFLDEQSEVLASHFGGLISSASARDTYMRLMVGAVSPQGTAFAQIRLRFHECSCPDRDGVVYFDGADLWQIPSPGAVGLFAIAGTALARRRRSNALDPRRGS